MEKRIQTHYYNQVVTVDGVATYLNAMQEKIGDNRQDSWIDETFITYLDKSVLVVVKVCTMVE